MKIEINIKGFFKVLKYGILGVLKKMFSGIGSKLKNVETTHDIFGGMSNDVNWLNGPTTLGLIFIGISFIPFIYGDYYQMFIIGSIGFCLSFVFWYVLLKKFILIAEEYENEN